ncbi:DUF2461 domain-containing protein [Candidatus Latescibacterota bacterium]
MNTFSGFSQKSLDFLKQVKLKNSKHWFEKHRPEYEKQLVIPFRQLVSDVAPAILTIDPDIEVRPSINKTISRIFRDTRFSSDKSLFRDTMWLVFKRSGKDWTTSIPGFYFEISPQKYRYGMGFYNPAPKVMAAFREKIDESPKAFKKVISFMETDKRYGLEGEIYKRKIPCEYPKNINAWYQMKSFYLANNCKPDKTLFSEALSDELIEGFLLTAPLYRYLVEIITK